jgi:lysophospholipase L1-like esterase
MRRSAAAVAVAAAAVFGWQAGARAQTAPAVNPWISAYRNSVYMTGDSLTWGTAPYLQYLFDLQGWELQVKAYPGVTLPQALPWTQAEVAAPPMPPTAVVALGANDTEPLPQLMWWIEGMIDTLPRTEHIIWVNYYSRFTDDSAKNAVLNFVASLHSNVTVLDWASVIRQHPEDLLPDGVHYTPTGYALRALTIGAALPSVAR